ncbi:MAG: BCD family MFS transporter [Chloroflexota bacterium]
MSEKLASHFSIRHTLRLSTFQIGSAMGDILVTSIWNRIMISNLGIPATPVSFLIALRYLLSPLSLWAGFLSDTKPLFGLRRTAYIWLGRSLMVLSLPLLGWSIGYLSADQGDVLGWGLATGSSLFYGIGSLISGSPFLALVRDSAPKERQGLAISTAETILIIFFAIVGITFSFWMEVYDERIFWQMIIATMVIGGFFWFFAIWGAEKRADQFAETAVSSQQAPQAHTTLHQMGFVNTFNKIWQDKRTRQFFFFLSLSTLAAWGQDAILEPFGAEVFDLPVSRTTRLNSYWQGATVITLVVGAWLWRKRPPEQQSKITSGGLLTMAAGMALLGLTSLAGQVRLIELSLLIFGFGFGFYTFGGLSLMAVMASDKEAGAYLGLWTISILLFKGLGTFLGGALRDLLLLQLQQTPALSYGLVFLLLAIGLAGSVLILARLDILGFAKDMGRSVSRSEAQVLLAD